MRSSMWAAAALAACCAEVQARSCESLSTLTISRHGSRFSGPGCPPGHSHPRDRSAAGAPVFPKTVLARNHPDFAIFDSPSGGGQKPWCMS